MTTDGRTGAGISPPRALLLVLLAWWTLTLGAGLSSWCFLDLVNLAFHESGHLFLSFAGTTVHYLGGTLGQLLVPTALAFHFLLKQRQPLGAAFCTWWAGENLVNVAVYMGDARSLVLPLVGGGDHDWNELFYRFGMLTETSVGRVTAATHLLGTMIMLIGLAWTGYFVLPADRRARMREVLTARWPWMETALES